MVKKLESRTVTPSKKLQALKPVTTPKPAAARTLVRDELSTGKGGRLRVSAERQLGAKALSGKAPESPSGGFRVGALASLTRGADLAKFAGGLDVAAARSGATQGVQDKAEENLANVFSPEGFAYAIQNETDPAVRDEMVRQAMESDDPNAYFGPMSPTDPVNVAFDQMSVIAGAVDSAFRSGAIDQETINGVVSEMDEEEVEFFLQGMQIEGNNRALGGVVEAIGVAAEAEGYDRAAALAFTSSEALIDKHLPTEADQRAAFEEVEAFIEDFDDRVGGGFEAPGPYNALQFAMGSAARLTARGTGYTEEALREQLEELGPRMTQEIVARLGEASRFDGGVPGALDTLGDAAMAMAGDPSKDFDELSDEEKDWLTAASIAYTQTPQLISQNLGSDAQQLRAIESINHFLAGRRDQFGDAADDGFSLLRDPQAIEGLNNLLARNPGLIGKLATGGPEGEATLVQLFESITLNPDVPPELREAFDGHIQSFVEDTLATVGTNANEAGSAVGNLLGLLQVAGNRAVEHADGDDRTNVQNLLSDFGQNLASGVVGLLLAPTGPVGSIVGGAVASQVLDAIFGSSPGPSRSDIERAFVDRLREAGIDVSSGEATFDAIDETLGQQLDALNVALAAERDPAKREQLQQQINQLEQFKDAIEGNFGGSIDSEGGAGGQLAVELNDREDEP